MGEKGVTYQETSSGTRARFWISWIKSRETLQQFLWSHIATKHLNPRPLKEYKPMDISCQHFKDHESNMMSAAIKRQISICLLKNNLITDKLWWILLEHWRVTFLLTSPPDYLHSSFMASQIQVAIWWQRLDDQPFFQQINILRSNLWLCNPAIVPNRQVNNKTLILQHL